MEQQLINAFMKLTAKAGAGALVRELIQQVDENRNPKDWSRSEMENAIHYINYLVENFGKQEAMVVIRTLMKKFDIETSELANQEQPMKSEPSGIPDPAGVQGLQ